MNINATSPMNSYFATANTKKTSPFNPPEKAGISPTLGANEPKTSVDISAKARTLLPTSVEHNFPEDRNESIPFTRDPSLPDEAYAIPSWRVGLYVDVDSLWGAAGVIGPGNSKYEKYSQGSASEHAEYSELLHKHIQDLYEKHGLSSASDRYHSLKSVPGLDERLHNEFNASIASDERMTALIEKLGFSLS